MIEIENAIRTSHPNTFRTEHKIGLSGVHPNKGGLSKRPPVLIARDLGGGDVLVEAPHPGTCPACRTVSLGFLAGYRIKCSCGHSFTRPAGRLQEVAE